MGPGEAGPRGAGIGYFFHVKPPEVGWTKVLTSVNGDVENKAGTGWGEKPGRLSSVLSWAYFCQ